MRAAITDGTLQPNPTISVLNILDLRKIVNFLYKHNLATDYDLNLSNLLVGPEWLSITVLPAHLKQIAKENLELLIEDLDNYDMYKERKQFLKNGIDNIINFMYNKDDTGQIPEFKLRMQELDYFRKENFTEVFPEMKDLYV